METNNTHQENFENENKINTENNRELDDQNNFNGKQVK